MAIRIGNPPALARLRLRWHGAYNYYLRQSRAIDEIAVRCRNHVRQWQRSANRYFETLLSREARQLARRKTAYACFAARYEDLVTVLCWAAKDGDHTDRDAKYASIRDWMQLNYHRIRPQLRAHLETWEGPFDPFEELFASECIDEVINACGTIANLMCTRSALDAYRAALEATATIR